MKKVKQEVKTIYDIEVKFSECWDLLIEFKNEESNEIIYPKLAKVLEEYDVQIRANAKIIIENSFAEWHSNLIQYITKKLKFDGIVNYGYYNKNKQVITCQVYNYGDCIN